MIKFGSVVVGTLCAAALAACAAVEEYDFSSQDAVAAGCVISAASDLVLRENPDTTSDLTNVLCTEV